MHAATLAVFTFPPWVLQADELATFASTTVVGRLPLSAPPHTR